MVTIPQHGKSGELHDMQVFLSDVDAFFVMDAWHVQVDECLGEGADEIEQITAKGVIMNDSEFRAAYKRIYQTIDGLFLGLKDGVEVCSLLAIDSTSWDVKSSKEFESHMIWKYGGRWHHEV